MKKHILLTTTAMLLSAMALNANAETTTPSNTTQLDIKAVLISPMEFEKITPLNFGVVLVGEKGETVIVTADGDLDARSTATLLYSGGAASTAYDVTEGRIKLKDIDHLFSDAEAWQTDLSVVIDETPVDLMSYEGSIHCGSVEGFNTKLTQVDRDVIIHIGGTFTTADLGNRRDSQLSCVGSKTVTILLNPSLNDAI